MDVPRYTKKAVSIFLLLIAAFLVYTKTEIRKDIQIRKQQDTLFLYKYNEISYLVSIDTLTKQVVNSKHTIDSLKLLKTTNYVSSKRIDFKGVDNFLFIDTILVSKCSNSGTIVQVRK